MIFYSILDSVSEARPIVRWDFCLRRFISESCGVVNAGWWPQWCWSSSYWSWSASGDQHELYEIVFLLKWCVGINGILLIIIVRMPMDVSPVRKQQDGILHSAEEDYLSPFDSKIACLCQSIEIKCISPEPGAKANRQWSQVGWMLTHHRDGLLSSSLCLILDSSVGLWVSSLLANWYPGFPSFESCIQQRKTTCILSIRKSLACARTSKLTANLYRQLGSSKTGLIIFWFWPMPWFMLDYTSLNFFMQATTTFEIGNVNILYFDKPTGYMPWRRPCFLHLAAAVHLGRTWPPASAF